MAAMHELILEPLDGANPLGLFAALGVAAAVADAGIGSTLEWRYSGGWRAVLRSACADVDDLVAVLDADRKACLHDRMLALEYDGKRDLKPPPHRLRELLESLMSDVSPTRRRSIDWASSFMSEGAVANKGDTKPTAFHFTAGQQQFLQMVGELLDGVTPDDLREAVVGPWRYTRPLPVMGWDATTSRDYALRAKNPSIDSKYGVPGADWLGVRGLVFFPTLVRGTRLLTTGCSGGWKDGTFTWPLWTVPLSADALRSVFSLNVAAMPRDERLARGVGAVFASRIRRSDQGGYGSFEPAAVA